MESQNNNIPLNTDSILLWHAVLGNELNAMLITGINRRLYGK
jgi:hypothetical protein